MKEKEQALVESISTKLKSLINQLKLIIQLEIKSSQMPHLTLKEKLQTFKQELKIIKQQKEDSEYILRGETEKIVKEGLIEDIDLFKKKELPKMVSDLEQIYKNNQKLNGIELAKRFNLFLENSIKKKFNDWRKAEEKKLQKSLKFILNRFTKSTNQSIEKIINLSANLFDISLEKFTTELELVEEQEFRFSFDEIQVEIEIFTPIFSRLPKFLSHRFLYQNIKEKTAEEFDKHCGRVRFDFHQRLLKTINEYQIELDRVFEEIISEIEKAIIKGLKLKQKTKQEADDFLNKLYYQEKTLLQIQKQLTL
ncbi:MAG: hypothetical protein QHH09_01080 [Microgenomates group bacterium]|nr:hypothetical protein [Microgenomates group bacterium]